MEFTFEPYVGVLPIKFGMTPTEVTALIGKPDKSRVEEDSEIREIRRNPLLPFCIYYSASGGLAEISFEPGSVVRFNGISLFDHKNLIDVLITEDTPKIGSGILVFLKLGISIGADHDAGGNQNTAFFERGRWDRQLGCLEDYER